MEALHLSPSDSYERSALKPMSTQRAIIVHKHGAHEPSRLLTREAATVRNVWQRRSRYTRTMEGS